MNKSLIALAIAASTALTACSSTGMGSAVNSNGRQISGVVYGAGGALQAGTAVIATVVSVRTVEIVQRDEKTGAKIGAGAGGAIGGALGASMQNGTKNSALTGVLGATIGALGGGMVGDLLGKKKPSIGQEIMLRVPGLTKMLVVTQADANFKKGQRVAVTMVGEEYRVAEFEGDSAADDDEQAQKPAPKRKRG